MIERDASEAMLSDLMVPSDWPLHIVSNSLADILAVRVVSQ